MPGPGDHLSRRTLLAVGAALGAGGVGVLAVPQLGRSEPPLRIGPRSAQVAAAESQRSTTGKTVVRSLRAAPTQIDLGGRTVSTAAYDGTLPGPAIRVTAGDRLQVAVTNDLPVSTTVHWHGLALRNDMDGVPTLTQQAIAAGSDFRYDFVVPDPGTYWFHPHVGVQLDTGLYAPLIVEDPNEKGAYDDEIVLVLDDWTDGWGTSPDDLLDGFAAEGMASMSTMGSMDDTSSGVTAATPLGTDTGDVVYPAHLINGRLPENPEVIRRVAGQRIRLRIINAGSDTAYRFAVGGHRLTVTHTDGFPVVPVTVDTLIIGMGERYDVQLDVIDGTYPIAAEPEGKSSLGARALLTTGSGSPPPPGLRPVELDARLLTYDDLVATEAAALGSRSVDRELSMSLTMGKGGRQWLINGKVFHDREPLSVTQGERVRLTMTNESMMFHPMHLHGHTFGVARASGAGPRKDTINVLPRSKVVVDLDADNPGRWLAHCHNVYHGELGMMTEMSYVQERT